MDFTKLPHEQNFLSTDLQGYVSYMLSRGYEEDYVSQMTLAPKLLFELFGSFSSLTVLEKPNYKSEFLDLFRHRYTPGTLRRYSVGITHYHNYLVRRSKIQKAPDLGNKNGYIRKPFLYYHKRKSHFFENVEVDYRKHLSIEMAYCDTEIRKGLAAYKKFASYLMKKNIKGFLNVEGQHIIEFGNLRATTKTDWNQLKKFLKFGFRQGLIGQNLSGVIITRKTKKYRKKRFLAGEKIDQLISSLDRSTTVEKRNYAMFALMARLGVRPSETTRVKLTDIDWVNSRILIRGKKNSEDWMPLTFEVAEAIVDYLKSSADYRTYCKYLFLRERAPYRHLKYHRPLTATLTKAYVTSGIHSPSGDVRLNVFRHSLATSLVNSDGQNFFTAQSVLRHSSPEMTMRYAKYHTKKLKLFEAEWPEDA